MESKRPVYSSHSTISRRRGVLTVTVGSAAGAFCCGLAPGESQPAAKADAVSATTVNQRLLILSTHTLGPADRATTPASRPVGQSSARVVRPILACNAPQVQER